MCGCNTRYLLARHISEKYYSLMHSLWAQRVAPNADAAQLANAMAATWQAIDLVLCPILGQQGVIALYKRSLYLTRVSHLWLAPIYDSAVVTLSVEDLRVAMSHEETVAARAGGDALLHTFNDLLVTLLGSSLTERLLHSVFHNSLSGPAAQDIYA